MESNYKNRDFEQFVKQNADQYRMFPSEKVWKGIHNTLHARRRWYGIGFALLLLTSAAVTWVMMNPPAASKAVIPANPGIPGNTVTPSQSSVGQNIPGVNIAPVVVRTPNISQPIIPGEEEKENAYSFLSLGTIEPAEQITKTEMESGRESFSPQTIINLAAPINDKNEILQQRIAKSADNFTFRQPLVEDNSTELSEPVSTLQSGLISESKTSIYPLTIESVVNSYAPARNRFNLQLYFTPTVSYRKLRENKSYLRSAAFANNPASLATFSDINSAVTHKPDMGLELGLSGGYQLTSVMKVKAGLQFNISRYDIKAFSFNGEVATIALNSGNDVVSVSSNYRNKSGYKANWLQNLYFSVSAPIGTEIKLGDNGRTSLNIGGTIQPTYIISDRAYLISSDYKNYAEVPWLIRKWNVNTSFETFVGYSTGKLKWQVGPQIRYQLLSSFQEKYPVKENLFDYGLKVGIMLNR